MTRANRKEFLPRADRKESWADAAKFRRFCPFVILAMLIFLSEAAPIPAFNQKPSIRLVPELTIGTEVGDKNLMFGAIFRVDADAEGNIYVLDTKNRQLRIFNKEGEFLRSIDIPPGQGPQETNQIAGIAVTPSGRVFINGDRKMVVYDSRGNYLRTFPVSFHVSCIGSPGTEEIVGIGPHEGKILHVFNSDGQMLSSFGRIFDVPKEFEPMKIMPMFGAPILFSCSKGGRIFVLNPHRYEILIFKNRRLETTLKGNSGIFEPVTQRGRAFTSTAAAIFPAGKYVLVYFASYKNQARIADIFLNGKQVGSLELPGELMAVDYDGKLYLASQEEYPKVIRCSMVE